MFLTGFLGLAIAACTSTASNVTTDYYLVSGTTSEALDRDIRRKGPMQGHALAVAAIRFVPVSVQQETTDEGCVFTEALFRIDANIMLPRWKERATSGDRELRSAWDSLARYAKAHEDVHVQIAERYARELGEAIEALPPRETCEALDNSAERVVKRMARRHQADQLAFDRAEQDRLEQLLRKASANNS
jgi:predicted secreted Zn-dependent protease